MQLPLLDAKEHGEVARVLRILPLDLHDIPDVLELRLGNSVLLPAQTAKDEARLLLAPGLDEPTRRLGHVPDDAEEGDERHDLEGDGEAPNEARQLLAVEGGAVLEPVGDDDAEDVEGEFDGNEGAA